MIKLHLKHNGNEVWVNTVQVTYVTKIIDGGTCIAFIGSDDNCVNVIENIDSIGHKWNAIT